MNRYVMAVVGLMMTAQAQGAATATAATPAARREVGIVFDEKTLLGKDIMLAKLLTNIDEKILQVKQELDHALEYPKYGEDAVASRDVVFGLLSTLANLESVRAKIQTSRDTLRNQLQWSRSRTVVAVMPVRYGSSSTN